MERYSFEKAQDEALEMQEKIKSGNAEDFSDTERLITHNNSESTIEELDNKCAEIAKKHIFNLRGWKKAMPVRIAYSGLLAKTYEEGFEEQSFLWDKTQSYFDYNDFVRYTRNDAFNDAKGDTISECFYGKMDNILDKNLESSMTKDDGTSFKDHLEARNADRESFSLKHQYIFNIFEQHFGELANEKMWALSKFIRFLEINASDEQFELVVGISLNVALEKNLNDWKFEEQDFLYETIVRKSFEDFMKNTPHAYQLFDMAYIINDAKISEDKPGYLDVERLITAKPDCIEGMVINGGPVKMDSYFIEKAKRIFRANPELSRPLYNTIGDLVWPEQKTADKLDEEIPRGDFDYQRRTQW